MRIVTYRLKVEGIQPGKGPRVGALMGDGRLILDFFTTCFEGSQNVERSLPADPCVWFNLDGWHWQRAREAFESTIKSESFRTELTERKAILDREDLILLAPVSRPGKLICVGLNYRDHAVESNMPIPTSPVIFSKFVTSVVGSHEQVVLPMASAKVDYEAELAVVIGRRAKNVSKEQALDYVFGYTNMNDVSARDFQFSDGQWQRGKSCDTFAPLGEYIATTEEIPDPHQLSIKLRLNAQTLQDSNTNQLIFGVPELIEFLSQTITLEPGDVIATGTPPGVDFARNPPVFLKPGDVMEVEIEGLGVLTNHVVSSTNADPIRLHERKGCF